MVRNNNNSQCQEQSGITALEVYSRNTEFERLGFNLQPIGAQLVVIWALERRWIGE